MQSVRDTDNPLLALTHDTQITRFLWLGVGNSLDERPIRSIKGLSKYNAIIYFIVPTVLYNRSFTFNNIWNSR